MKTAPYTVKHLFLGARSYFNLSCRIFFLAFLQTLIINGQDTPQQPPSQPQRLITANSGSVTRREIGTGEKQAYLIDLKSGEVIRLKVEKEDLRLTVKVFDPEENLVFHGTYQRYGDVEPWFVSRPKGTYKLEIESLEKDAASSPSSALYEYKLRITERHPLHPRDLKLFEAEKRFQEAEELRGKWARHFLESALKSYNEAVSLWLERGERQRAAAALEQSGEIYLVFGDYKNALDAYRKALAIGKKNGRDRFFELFEYCNIAKVNLLTGDFSEAERNLSIIKQHVESLNPNDRAQIEAMLFMISGEFAYAKGDLSEARRQLEKALNLWQHQKNRRGEAETALNLAYTNIDAGELVLAEQELDQALSLWRELGDLRGEAFTLTAEGHVRAFFLQLEPALKLHSDVQKIFEFIGDRQGEAVALNGMGYLYEVLNRPASAVSVYHQALEINKSLNNKSYLALTEFALARSYRLQKNFKEAERHYEESEKLCRKLNKTRIEAYIYGDLAKIKKEEGDTESALQKYNQTISFYKKIGDLRGQALVLAEIGDLYRQAENLDPAEKQYHATLELNRQIKDQAGISDMLYRLAEIEFKRENLQAALELINESISLSDEMREKLRSPVLRSSYGATNREKIELEIDILLERQQKTPQPQLIAETLEKVEASRARTLLELLAETRVEPRAASVDPELLKREKEIQSKLATRIDKEISLRYAATASSSAAASSVDELKKTEREIESLTEEYGRIQTMIKSQDSRYEKLVAPAAASIADIQSALQSEPDTVYLSYFLGSRKSYVWVVSQTEVKVFELDKKSDLENSAGEVYGQLTARQKKSGESAAQWQERIKKADQEFCRDGARLSRQLFGQILPFITGKRLLVSLDGALEYIPLEALPAPAQISSSASICRQPDEAFDFTPLLETNEIVYIPSFSILQSLRSFDKAEKDSQVGAPQMAVWADPVYEPDDPRLSSDSHPVDKHVQSNSSLDILSDLPEEEEEMPVSFPVRRLLNTQLEAKEIADLWTNDKATVFLGVAAARENVLGDNLTKYRFLHFAVHGFFNNAHPENSGLLLSRFNEKGARVNGFLSLQDIFQTRLNADLVVLSACQTGLGEQQISGGEGISGLKYALFYAGAKSAMVSLWQVDDSATAALMQSFYRDFLKKGLPSSVALRSAKLEMYHQKGIWQHPFYWAGFTLNGEYLVSAPENKSFFLIAHKKIFIFVLLVALVGAFYLFKKKLLRLKSGTK